MEGCSGFLFSEDLRRHFFDCFSASVSSGLFQTLFSRLIVTFFIYLNFRQVSLTSQTLSVSVAVSITCWMPVLEAIGTVEQKGSGL